MAHTHVAAAVAKQGVEFSIVQFGGDELAYEQDVIAGGLGLDPITLNQPGTVARTAPVAGSVLFVVLIPPNGTCSITGLSISVYLQP